MKSANPLYRVLLLTVPLILLGCAAQPEGTPDTEIGLSKSSVFDTPVPEAVSNKFANWRVCVV